jgi:large subunit ribosomal protein L10
VPTQEKIESVEQLRGRLTGVKTVLLTEYRGLTVSQLSDLRKQLRSVSAEYKVIKNRLARLALSPELIEVKGLLKGPTGMIISKDDPVAVAKALHTFAKTNQALVIKAGYIEGRMLQPDGLKALADLPSREALRAQLVGTITGPLTQLVSLLQAPQRELVYVLSQRGKGAETPAAAAGQP